MNIEQFPQFITIVNLCRENCSGEFSFPYLRLTFEALRPYTINQVWGAFSSIMLTDNSRKMPSLNTILDHIEQIDSKADTQAQIVIMTVKEMGRYNYPNFKDTITQKIIDEKFNWQRLCSGNIEDEKWFIKDFCSYYKDYSKLDRVKKSQPFLEFDRLLPKLNVKNIDNGKSIEYFLNNSKK
jgi:hypothetical protein